MPSNPPFPSDKELPEIISQSFVKEENTKKVEEANIRTALNNPSLPSDEEIMRIINESPFLKRKHQEAEEALSKIDLSKIFEKSSK